jgi:hypothetical protein
MTDGAKDLPLSLNPPTQWAIYGGKDTVNLINMTILLRAVLFSIITRQEKREEKHGKPSVDTVQRCKADFWSNKLIKHRSFNARIDRSFLSSYYS